MERKVKDMISVILSQAKQLYPKCSFTECEYGWENEDGKIFVLYDDDDNDYLVAWDDVKNLFKWDKNLAMYR